MSEATGLRRRRLACAIGMALASGLILSNVHAGGAIQLGELDGNNGFRLDGEALMDFSGSSVASAGDINGDGIDDILIGARASDWGGYNAGSSYIVFGSTEGFDNIIDLSTLDGSDGFRLDGAEGDYSGISAAGIGDLNGDGVDDIVIGASDAADSEGNTWAGRSYVVFGSTDSFSAILNLSALDGNNGFRLNGEPGTRSGFSVAGPGDVNGDGIDDLVIGAFLSDANGSDSGSSYVVFGSKGAFVPSLDLNTLDSNNGFRLNGMAEGERSGSSVSGAGDINGDGIADLIIGAPRAGPEGKLYAGSSYVVFGNGTFPASMDLGSLDGSNGFRLDGAMAYDQSGYSVAGVGDINGDGIDDLLVGAPQANFYAGSSYVVFGSNGKFAASLDLMSLDISNGLVLVGVADYSYSGRSVAGTSDINGDGIDDFVIGAFGASSNGVYGSGSSYVVFGKTDGFTSNPDLGSLDGSNGLRMDGAAELDFSGISVAGAGDVNGDGVADVLIGAQNADPNDSSSGSSYVVFGSGSTNGDRVFCNGFEGGSCATP